MTKLTKIGMVTTSEGRTITYLVGDGIFIKSRLRHIPHANGNGTWDHTTYHVIKDGVEVAWKNTLRDAREIAEGLVKEVQDDV